MGALEDLGDSIREIADVMKDLANEVQELKEKVEDGGMVIWTRKDLIKYLDGSETMARHLIDQPDFPKYLAGTKSKPLFCKKDVVEYIRNKANSETEEVPVIPVVLPTGLAGKGRKSALYDR